MFKKILVITIESFIIVMVLFYPGFMMMKHVWKMGSFMRVGSGFIFLVLTLLTVYVLKVIIEKELGKDE